MIYSLLISYYWCELESEAKMSKCHLIHFVLPFAPIFLDRRKYKVQGYYDGLGTEVPRAYGLTTWLTSKVVNMGFWQNSVTIFDRIMWPFSQVFFGLIPREIFIWKRLEQISVKCSYYFNFFWQIVCVFLSRLYCFFLSKLSEVFLITESIISDYNECRNIWSADAEKCGNMTQISS